MVQEADGVVVLLTSTEQPEWNDFVTLEVEGRFFKMIGHEERRMPGETFSVHAYRLREEPENAVIRRLERYEPYLGDAPG